MFKFTALVVSGLKRQYMVEAVHPQRWQDFLTECNRKLDWSMEKATLVMGKMDYLPRTVALPKITVGGVECAVSKWAWFLSAAGKEYLKRKETHLRLGKILRQLATDTRLKPAYIRYFYSYYSVCTDQVEVSSATPEFLFGFLPDDAAQAIESKRSNPMGELRCDWDDTFPRPKTADKLAERVTKYASKSHQQAAVVPAVNALGSASSVQGPAASSTSSSSVVCNLSGQGESAAVPVQESLQQTLAIVQRCHHVRLTH
eukprot:g69167.t1